MISKTKCIIGLLCISVIQISHSLPNDERQQNQDEQESNQSENKSCEVPASSADTIIYLSCKNSPSKNCVPSNGYVPEFAVAEVTCAAHYYHRRNVGNSPRTTHVCRNKQWVPRITKCVKRGSCSQSEEICVEAKNCVNGSELIKLETYRCRVRHFVTGVCCKHPINTTEPELKKNATAIALNHCEQYRQYKYVKKLIESFIPGEPGHYFIETHCVFPQLWIASGSPAIPMEYPHMAFIGYGNTFQDVEWNCGGSLISEKFILSAAHCAASALGSPKWVLLGGLNIRSDTDDSRPAVYDIVKIHKHPNYDETTKHDDIAIFELNATVALSPYVRPACLYTQTSKPIGIHGSITGWGRKDTTDHPSDHLLKTTIKVYNDSLCETKYKNMYNSTTMICAGDLESRKDSCVGDAGGPLQLPNGEICMWDIFGITSQGPSTCGSQEVPSVYTNVAHYLDWIQNIVWP